eukprot:TRINITY_DN51768_c0_g1_i1.p4 TRINITY_DN51768_c0_g1~~TRINITY_DN51768_c0_g1_i1.p4  ORF type:complete len:129 (-),score=11.30 TRINITY_DN51768_c0_g1_i1:1926-2279(-)
MSNKPPPDWNIDIEGEEKLRIEDDTKLRSACTFIINKEDHSLGNVLRMKLTQNEDVQFVGYKVPHPLIHQVHLKVQTNGVVTPAAAVSSGIQACLADVDTVARKFKEQVEKRKMETN